MELSEEEANFVKIVKIVLNVLPKYLRKSFINLWNRKHPNEEWKSNEESGNFMHNTLPEKVRDTNNKMHKVYLNKMKTGNEKEWDTSVLGFIIIDSGLKLIDESNAEDKLIKEGFFKTKEIRNFSYAHADKMCCSNANFAKTIADIKSIPGGIINEDAKEEIDAIAKLHISEKLTNQQLQQLTEEIRCDIELQKGKFLCMASLLCAIL